MISMDIAACDQGGVQCVPASAIGVSLRMTNVVLSGGSYYAEHINHFDRIRAEVDPFSRRVVKEPSFSIFCK